MLAGVERRFGTDRAPHPIERLSDNGGCRTAKDARDLAQALGLVPCFTPVRSPESDGTSEAFVKTLRRECARVTPPPDTATVLGLGLVSAWIDDRTTAHPHAASARHSPREFRAALNPSRTVR